MRRSVLAWVAAVVIAVAGAAFAYELLFAGGTAEPTTQLTTPEFSATTSTPTEETTASTTSSAGSVVEPTPAPFVIDPSQSTANFEVDEVLRGVPKVVVGTTDQVAGQVLIDPNDLSASQISEIVVNARTFETGSDQRDRTIRGPVILDSGNDEHELITFTPTSIDGLDGEVPFTGQEYQFEVTGDLTIRGTTNQATFGVLVEFVDEDTIRGTATTQVSRTDFGIGIPSLPFVADVGDEVTLTLEFTALTG